METEVGSAVVQACRQSSIAMRAECAAAAARLRAVYAIYEAVREELGPELEEDPVTGETHVVYPELDPWDVARDHVAEALLVVSARATTVLSLAIDLVVSYPRTLGALEEGELDERTAELLVSRLCTVSPALRGEVELLVLEEVAAVLREGRRLGRSGLITRIDRIVAEIDPDGLRARRERTRGRRHISFARGIDGMARLSGLLPYEQAELLRERIDQIAATGSWWRPGDTMPGDGRSDDARRADALLSLAFAGQEVPAPIPTPSEVEGDRGVAQPTPSSGGVPAEFVRPVLRPRISVITTVSPGGQPRVVVAGSGEVGLDVLLEMLAAADGAVLERMHPDPGAIDDPDRWAGYRIPAALARRVRERDGTCRHPGCSVPAYRCDLDHVVPFDHADPTRGGPTAENNLVCLCRRHHRHKTFGGWTYSLAVDGVLTVCTDAGRTVVTEPSGPLGLYREAAARARWDVESAREEAEARARLRHHGGDLADAVAEAAHGASTHAAAAQSSAAGSRTRRRAGYVDRRELRRRAERTRAEWARFLTRHRQTPPSASTRLGQPLGAPPPPDEPPF